jgi:[acyl-carrier-protein] S-malonyltransferase
VSERVAATVGGIPVLVSDVDRRETRLRASTLAAALPHAGTSEGRQLRRWLIQLLVTERVVAAEAAASGVTADGAPDEKDLLPDMAARLEIGSVAAAALEDSLGRALFAHVTADVSVGETEVADYHARNPLRFAAAAPQAGGWHHRTTTVPALADVRPAIAEHLLAAARRRTFRVWLDARRAELVELAPGYEHPGDPGQPDNTHKH